MLVLLLSLAIGQGETLPKLQKDAEDAQKKLADARQTVAQLVAALEVAQGEVLRANKDLEQAHSTLLRAQSNARSAQIKAEQDALDAYKSLFGPPKAVLPPTPAPKKQPPAKSIFDTKKVDPKPKETDPVAELAAILSTGNGASTAQVDFEWDLKPNSATLQWFTGQEGWNYCWLGDKPLVGYPPAVKGIENWQFFVMDRWIKYTDLKDGAPGRAGWSRRYIGNTPIISQKGSSAQMLVDGKWHWIPEVK